jgi:tRNA(fMet)-specific endonuclease VapC
LNLLLDTNIVSKLIRGREKSYRDYAAQSLSAGNSHNISVIVYFELVFGVLKSPDPISARAKLHQMLTRISEVHDLNSRDAEVAAGLRRELSARGELIGDYDLLIAAQALRFEWPIVTNNRKHFERIPNLKVIDWA